MNGGLFRFFQPGRRKWIPGFAGTLMPFKAQPRNESPVPWGLVVFPARYIQAVVTAKGSPVFGLVFFWTPACAGVTDEASGRVKKARSVYIFR